MKNTLFIGDIHLPVEHRRYLPFCLKLFKRNNIKQVYCVGDICDWSAISFHAKHPNSPAPYDEYILTKKRIKKWYKAFPNLKICIGNHDCLPYRQAEAAGIPDVCLRSYNDLWETPGWTWKREYIINDEIYIFHGRGQGGKYPAYNAMLKMQMSVIMGHTHSRAGVKYHACPNRLTWGMDVGCGIDRDAWAMYYGREMLEKPILSVGMIVNNVPIVEAMPL